MTTQQQTKTQTTNERQDNEVQDASSLTREMEERSVTFTPFAEKAAITLTFREVRQLIANPTKQGKLPTDRQIAIFLRLCQYRKLNPWVKDVFLLGYDTKEGAKFEPIIAHQAYLKRADASDHFDGMESGITVMDPKTNEVRNLEGDVCPPSLEIIGGWARVARSDRAKDVYKTASMKSYNKRQGHWNTDPGWMVCKCAEAKCLREAFPNDLGGAVTVEEFGLIESTESYDDDVHNESLHGASTAASMQVGGHDTDVSSLPGSAMVAGEVPVDKIVIGDQTPGGPTTDGDVTAFESELRGCTSLGAVTAVREKWEGLFTDDGDKFFVAQSCDAKEDVIRSKRSVT